MGGQKNAHFLKKPEGVTKKNGTWWASKKKSQLSKSGHAKKMLVSVSMIFNITPCTCVSKANF